jgi:hypothetical protein
MEARHGLSAGRMGLVVLPQGWPTFRASAGSLACSLERYGAGATVTGSVRRGVVAELGRPTVGAGDDVRSLERVDV